MGVAYNKIKRVFLIEYYNRVFLLSFIGIFWSKISIKKEIVFNKESRKRTGGGPFEELALSSAEELILEAAGIEVAVDGLFFVKPFNKKSKVSKNNEDEILEEILVEDNSQSEDKEDVGSDEVTV